LQSDRQQEIYRLLVVGKVISSFGAESETKTSVGVSSNLAILLTVNHLSSKIFSGNVPARWIHQRPLGRQMIPVVLARTEESLDVAASDV